ncbi:MAG: PAS domain S-box protein [bacterium]
MAADSAGDLQMSASAGGRSQTFALVTELLAAIPLPAFVVDEQHRVHYLNGAARQRSPELTPEESPCYTRIFRRKQPCELCVMTEVVADGADHVLCRQEIAGQTVRATGLPFTDEGGSRYVAEIVHMGGEGLVSSQSTTELREDAMQSVIDSSGEAILLFDSTFRPILSNRAAQLSLGYTAAELADLTLQELGIASTADELGKVLRRAAEAPPAVARAMIVSKAGGKMPVKVNLSLLVGSSTRILGSCHFAPPRLSSAGLQAVPRPGSGQVPKSGATRSPSSPVAKAPTKQPPAPQPPMPQPPARPKPAAASAAPADEPLRPRRKAGAEPATRTMMGSGPVVIPPGAPVKRQRPEAHADAPASEAAAPETAAPETAAPESFEPMGTEELDLSELDVTLDATAEPPPVPPAAAPASPPPTPSPRPPATPLTVDAGVSPATEPVTVQVAANPPRVVAASEGIEALLGYSRDTVLQWSADDWFVQVHEPKLADDLSGMWKGLVGQRFEPGALPDQIMEYPLVRQDGSVVQCSTTWRAVQGADGTFEGLEVLIRPK